MRPAPKSARTKNALSASLGLTGALWLSACGTPGTPQAPSLRLPEPVTDLTAVRAGGAVTLHWTMPRKTTDRLLIAKQISGPVPVLVCRREQRQGSCEPAGELALAPEAAGEFHDTLPPKLITGPPRQIQYFVELRNKSGPSGRSAGLSNAAVVLAGAAPGAIAGLAAEVRADGVALRWTGAPASNAVPVRLHRKLLTPAGSENKPKKSESGLMSPPPETILRDLLVESGPENSPGALDTTARFGQDYEYTAQRVERVSFNGKTLELAGENSPPLKVAVLDTFPPAVPTGLAAVLVPEEKTIDLSWQPNIEEDLAGYIVYRIASGDASNGNGLADWIRISGPKPLPGPSYRDASVQPGQNYRYAVTAIDQLGHESQRSAEAQESVPNP